jgi:hypothetical protein
VSLALFTIVQDETTQLELWLAHHRQCAPTAQLYVLDHDSQGDSQTVLRAAQQLGAVVIPVRHSKSFNYYWLARVVEDFAAFLLRSFNCVGFTEVDELLYPVKHATLEQYLAATPGEFYRATARCVVHYYPQEPNIDWTRPWLAQRTRWYTSLRYSKWALMRRPVYYRAGFHDAYNIVPADPDSNLILLHTHQADFATTLARHRKNAGRLWDGDSRASECGQHQRLDNPERVTKYLLCDLDDPLQYAACEDIPADIKTAYTVCLPNL